MNKKSVLPAIVFVIIVWALLLSKLKPTRSVYFADRMLEIPKEFSVDKVAYKYEDWRPNGYCGSYDDDIDCDLLKLTRNGSTIYLSTPKKFGFLVSDVQECFKEVEKRVVFGSVGELFVTEFYHNTKQIHYRPELIDKGENPYDCTDVKVTQENFHHLSGCSGNDLCFWAEKNQGKENFNFLVSH